MCYKSTWLFKPSFSPTLYINLTKLNNDSGDLFDCLLSFQPMQTLRKPKNRGQTKCYTERLTLRFDDTEMPILNIMLV